MKYLQVNVKIRMKTVHYQQVTGLSTKNVPDSIVSFLCI